MRCLGKSFRGSCGNVTEAADGGELFDPLFPPVTHKRLCISRLSRTLRLVHRAVRSPSSQSVPSRQLHRADEHVAFSLSSEPAMPPVNTPTVTSPTTVRTPGAHSRAMVWMLLKWRNTTGHRMISGD